MYLSELKILAMETQTLLKIIGGQASVARECDITDQAVSQWASDGEIPQARRKYLELLHPGAHWDEYDKTPTEDRKRSASTESA